MNGVPERSFQVRLHFEQRNVRYPSDVFFICSLGAIAAQRGQFMNHSSSDRCSHQDTPHVIFMPNPLLSSDASLLILALTHSPVQAGVAAALRTLPYLALSLPAGALVDRWNRKRVMVVCDSARFLSMVSVMFALCLGHLTIVHLYVVSLLEGSLFVFFDLAEVSSLPQVVSKEQLPAASAQNIATYHLANAAWFTTSWPPLHNWQTLSFSC